MNRPAYPLFFGLAVAFLLIIAGCTAAEPEQDTSYSDKQLAVATNFVETAQDITVRAPSARISPQRAMTPMIVEPDELESDSFDDTYEELVRNHPFGKTVRSRNGLVAPVDTMERRELPSYCMAGVHGEGAYDYTGYGASPGTGEFFRFNLYPDGEGNPATWESLGLLQDRGTTMTDFGALAYFQGYWYGMNNEQGAGGSHNYLDDFDKSGFLAHWKLDDGSWNGTPGEVTDSTGNYPGRAMYDTYVYPFGKHDTAAAFDGSYDHISTGFYDVGHVKTLNFWVKFNSVNNGNQLLGVYEYNHRLYLGLDSYNRIFAGFGNKYIGSGYSSPNSGIKSGEWAMMTMTQDSSNYVHNLRQWSATHDVLCGVLRHHQHL